METAAVEYYKQISFRERRQIYTFLDMGFKVSDIADRLKRHKSTIYRELERNQGNNGYLAHQAHIKTQARKHRRPFKLV